MNTVIRTLAVLILSVLLLVVAELRTQSLGEGIETSTSQEGDTYITNVYHNVVKWPEPDGHKDAVDAPAIAFNKGGEYRIRVGFKPPPKGDQPKRFVRIYSEVAHKDCNNVECWSLVASFSNQDTLRERVIVVNKDSRWLVASWPRDYSNRHPRFFPVQQGWSIVFTPSEGSENVATITRFTRRKLKRRR